MRTSLKTTTIAIGLLFSLFSSPSWGGIYPDVEILHQSPQALEFVYRPAEATWLSSDESIEGFSQVLIPHTTLYQALGDPQVPVRLIYFALPPGADYEFSIVDETWRARPNVRLRRYDPLPFEPRPEGPEVARPDSDGADRFPERHIQRLTIGQLRSQRVGGLGIFPIIYHQTARRAEILESITVRVRFLGGESVVGTVDEGAFDRILSNMLLNARTSVLLRKKAGISPRLARQADEDPFGEAYTWFKLRTEKEGIYRLTYAVAESLGLDPGGIDDPRQIRIFYGGGKSLPFSAPDSTPAYREIALLTEGFADGSWDTGDYLEFYGQDLHRWEIQPETADFVNVRHPFEVSNVYWLTPRIDFNSSPLRITVKNAAPSGPAVQIFDIDDWAHHEKNLVLRVKDREVKDYYTWYWQSAPEIPIALFNVVDVAVGRPAMLHAHTYSLNNPVRLQVNGTSLDPVYHTSGNDTTVFRIDSYAPGTSMEISFASGHSSITYLDSYDLRYRRRLKLRGGKLKFAAPDTSATAVFMVSDAGSSVPVVWDVTDPYNPVELTGVVLDGTVAQFQTTLAAGRRAVFWMVEKQQWFRPASAERRSPGLIQATDQQADFLAIGPRHFVDAADNYLGQRESTTGLKVKRIDIEDIYDHFSSGLMDPLATRRFLKYTFENWQSPAPQYVMLVGDGHYDPADNMHTGAAYYVPPYLAPDEGLPSDENYVYFGKRKVLSSTFSGGGDPYPDMIIGRWPVKNTEQVRTIAAKINRYSSPATFGSWRNRIALVADDEYIIDSHGNCGVYGPGNEIHIIGAEYLSFAAIPAGFEQRKIYLTEFPFGSTCRSKPGARQAILDIFNEGAAIIDYIGHGNPNLWAHEHVLERATDVPKMQNIDRLTVMFAASCSNGFFDEPLSEGLAEELVRAPDGGAVAAISATRLVYADQNLSLNALVFTLLLDGEAASLGEALYLAKVIRQFEQGLACPFPPCERPNDRKYVLFGDPAMRFGAPQYRVIFDTVEPDTLPALGLVNVQGRIADAGGQTLTDFTGSAEFLVSDALRQRRYQSSENVRIDYELPGGTIYRGISPVAAGEFSFSFIVPKDITYGGTTAKIVGYAASDFSDAGGGIGSLHLGGTAPAITDTTGPVVKMYSKGRPLSDGMMVAPESELTAVIEDTSGVNLTGEPGHAITVMFDEDRANVLDVTSAFIYDPGSFRRGSVRFVLPDGRHGGAVTVTVKAWDNANNSGQLEARLALGTDEKFRVTEFLNYPNPFDTRTTFYFQTNGLATRASIEVYTVAGRLIKTIRRAIDGQTAWDGTDDLGQKVGNGVYLSKLKVQGRPIEATGSMADKTAERVQKVVLWR